MIMIQNNILLDKNKVKFNIEISKGTLKVILI